MKEIIPAPKPEIPEDKKESKEEQLKKIAYGLVYEWHNEPVSLTREERRKMRESGTKENLELVEKYKNSKFRNNYFGSVFTALYSALDNNLIPVENREALMAKRDQFFRDFKALKTADGNPISLEMVERADELLKEVFNFKENKEH